MKEDRFGRLQKMRLYSYDMSKPNTVKNVIMKQVCASETIIFIFVVFTTVWNRILHIGDVALKTFQKCVLFCWTKISKHPYQDDEHVVAEEGVQVTHFEE